MGKNNYARIFFLSIVTLAMISAFKPEFLSDNNTFLSHFVNHEYLALLGIFVTITLASVANIHFEFNRIEDVLRRRALKKTREKVNCSALSLIVVFGIALVVVVAKPLLGACDLTQALVNSIALSTIMFNILVMADITMLIQKIPPMFTIREAEQGEINHAATKLTETEPDPRKKKAD